MISNENINNRTYIFGDFDKDGTKNIDDSYPFNKKKDEPAQEIDLSFELNKIRKHTIRFRDSVKKLEKLLKPYGRTSSRIKGTNSIINKFRRKMIKNPEEMGKFGDLGGVRLYVKDRDHAEEMKSFLPNYLSSKDIEVLDIDDKYDNYDDYYRAIHFDTRVDGYFVELQVLTWNMAQLAHKGHKWYKIDKLTPDRKKKLIEEGYRKNIYR